MNGVISQLQEVREWLGTGSINSFGQPFAGKDTQSEIISKLWGGVPILGGGQILRESPDLPREIRENMDSGEIIDSETYRRIVVPYLSSTAFAGQPLLLSSVGRSKGEEVGVIAATNDSGHPIKAVPYFVVTPEESYRRLEKEADRGRADDTPEKLALRLVEFEKKTLPVIEAYEEAGLLLTIDAMAPKNIVFKSLVNALHERAMAA